MRKETTTTTKKNIGKIYYETHAKGKKDGQILYDGYNSMVQL